MPQPSWWRPGVAILGLGVLALVCQGFIRDDEWWVPGAFTIAIGLILLPALRRALRRGAEQVLADHLLVLAGAFMAYCVFGALLIPFGPQEQAEYSLSYYAVDAPLAMRVTAVNCIGFGLALVSGSLVRRHWVSKWARTAIGFGRSVRQKWIIAAFLLIGGASWFHVFTFDSGLRPGMAPGLVRTMSQLLLVAIMVAAAYRGRGSVWLLSLAVALTVIQALVGLLLLNKSSVLLPLMVLLAGLAWRLGVRRVLVPGLPAVLAIFLLVGGPVSTGRYMFGFGERVVWSERIAVLSDAVLRASDTALDSDYPSWARLNYLSSQGAALDFYDTGRGGDDYRLLGWVVLPRFLFPEKPEMTASGRDFHYQITGSDTSSSGQGVFINGYYNLGWWGVIVVGIAVGCMLAWTSAFAAEVFRVRALIWLPMALLGSMMAFRIDGAFVADYWGPFVLLSYAAFSGVCMQTLLYRNRRR